jgi:hypothetical protein
MALIEIDGLPFLKMVDLSMAMLVITRGYMFYRFLLAAHKPLGNTRNERHLKICTLFSLFTFARVHTKKSPRHGVNMIATSINGWFLGPGATDGYRWIAELEQESTAPCCGLVDSA